MQRIMKPSMFCTRILFAKEASRPESSALANPRAPTFYTRERIRGAVLISHIDTEEPVFDTVQILLRGDVTIVVHLKADIYSRTEKPLLRMSCVRAGKDFERFSTQKAVTSQCTFCFEMPQSITLPSLFNETDMKCGFQQLPPSIRIVEAMSNKSLIASQSLTPGVCDVAYYIDARFFLKGHVVRETTREIMVMPVTETPPPIDPGDLRNEYRLLASSPIGISWRRRRPLTVSISSSEPLPLNFEASRAKEDLPLTELLITFSARHLPSEGDSTVLAQPEITECDLIITIEATTYFLRNEEHSVLSISEAFDTPFSVVKTTKFKPQRLRVRFLNWEKAKESSSNDFNDWEATVTIPAHLPSDAPRLPSFFSTLVSRRYAFHVQAKLSSESGICSHDRLRLKVPVQVIHAPLETEFDEREEEDSDDEAKVPDYVP